MRFTEIKRALESSSQKVTRAIKRPEEVGYLFTNVGSDQHRPTNEYLAVDPENPDFKARVVNDNGWLVLVLEWSGDEGHRKSVSMSYGEIADWRKSGRARPSSCSPSGPALACLIPGTETP